MGGEGTGIADVVFVSQRVWDEIKGVLNTYSHSGGTFGSFNVVFVLEWCNGQPCDIRAHKNIGHVEYTKADEDVEPSSGDDGGMEAYEMTVTDEENVHTLETKLDDSLFNTDTE